MIQKISIRLNQLMINLILRITPILYFKSIICNLRRQLFILLMLTIFHTISCAQDEDIYKIFNRAYYYLSVDKEKALELLDQCIEIDSTFADAYFHRGITYFKLSKYDSALEDFKQVHQIRPNQSIIWMYKGFAYRNKGKNDLALACFSNYISQNPKDTSAYSYILRGKIKYELGDFEGAVNDYDYALNLDPFEEKYQYYRFIALFESNEYRKAIMAVNNLIAINRDFYGYYFYKGNVYSELQQYDSAIFMYNIAIIKNYQNADSYYHRAKAYENLNEFDKALEDYNTAILLKSTDGTFYSHRGNCKYKMGMKKAACQDWNKAGALGYYEDFDKMKKVCDTLNSQNIDSEN